MIKALKQFFDENLHQAPDRRPREHDLQIAAAALLFEISRSDERTNSEERDKIAALVQRQFQLSDDEAGVLLDLAEQEAHESTSLHGFVTLINSDWTEQQRLELVEHMWQIAYLDDQLDDHEVHLMRKIQRLLYIPHKKFIGAKLRARDADNGSCG
jgi:uncharacterized tellurite resistance protein B-like protein